MTKITYPLRIDKELWQRFKGTVSKNETINEVLIRMIKKRIKEGER